MSAAIPTLPLDEYLKRQPSRCSGCGYHPTLQDGCRCNGETLRDTTLSAIHATADPDVKRRLEAAIRRLAATGQPFSMNDIRGEVDASGGVVGSVFGHLAHAGVIREVDRVRSTKANTKAHKIAVWVGVAAERAA